jgi:hypothetical protein
MDYASAFLKVRYLAAFTLRLLNNSEQIPVSFDSAYRLTFHV